MKYYVPVGRGGLLFRVALAITRLIGSLFYWQASRRRAAATTAPEVVLGCSPASLDLAQLATRNVAMASVSR